MSLQFLLRSSDEDVERYLNLFTFLPTASIATTMASHAADPGKRKAQHLLAREVLELVHGRDEAIKTRTAHQALRSPTLTSLAQQRSSNPSPEPPSSAQSTPSTGAERTALPSSLVLNTPFSCILYYAGIAPTKSEGARLVAKGGVYVATLRSSPSTAGTADEADESDLVFVQLRDHQKSEAAQEYIVNGMLVFRVGKWKVRVVDVIEDAEFEARGLEAPGWREWRAGQGSR